MTVSIFGIILVSIAFICDTGFVLRYTTNFRWWKSAIGSQFVAMAACLGALYGFSLLVRIYPTLPGRMYVSLGLFFILTCVTAWRWFVFEKIIRQLRKDRADKTSKLDHHEEDEPLP